MHVKSINRTKYLLLILILMCGKLTGGITNTDGAEPTKFSNVEEKENSVTVYFSASGYDVYLTLEKKGDNKVEGSIMDMFDAKGERVVRDVVK